MTKKQEQDILDSIRIVPVYLSKKKNSYIYEQPDGRYRVQMTRNKKTVSLTCKNITEARRVRSLLVGLYGDKALVKERNRSTKNKKGRLPTGVIQIERKTKSKGALRFLRSHGATIPGIRKEVDIPYGRNTVFTKASALEMALRTRAAFIVERENYISQLQAKGATKIDKKYNRTSAPVNVRVI